jgi:hypothetical protein
VVVVPELLLNYIFLNPPFEPPFAIQLWFKSCWALFSPVMPPAFFYLAERIPSSLSVKRYCMQRQMKSCAVGEILERIALAVIKVEFNDGSKSLDYVSMSISACKRQQWFLYWVSLDNNSSLTMSSPSVAAIVSISPKSNKSYFLSSCRLLLYTEL